LLLEVEDFVEHEKAGVWGLVAEILEELGHLRLPPGVDLRVGHARLGGLERRSLEVSDQQTVRT
jgi:hypothetical protein